MARPEAVARGTVADNEQAPTWGHLAHGALGLLTKILRAVVDSALGADFWSADTRVLAAGEAQKIVERDRFRRAVVVTNQGTNPAMVSPSRPSSMNGQNACLVPAGAGRRLNIKGDVWAFSAAGTTVDIQDERSQSFDE